MVHRPSEGEHHWLAALAVRMIEAPPAARDSILDEALGDRHELREVLINLVDASSCPLARDPLDALSEAFHQAVAQERLVDPIDQSGTVLDRFTLRKRLGAGTYGSVYLADQHAPVERQVALKLLHPGVASPLVLRRFAFERRVLASMNHPGIARLLDAGAAPDGRPYLVMDLINGPDLATHCRMNAPTEADRVRMLISVCDAVQHTHGRGVIHRDLKPGNILVQSGSPPLPVVIDFGIARLLDPDPEHALTSLGQQIGTRKYMSPEQRAGAIVDVRSDVYALGVTLLDIIGGAPEPAMRDSVEQSLSDAPRAFPDESVRRLPKELRWIVECCCAEHPEGRYTSVSELAADLRRFLAHEPLTAAPPSRAYRVSRFIARNPWPTGLMAMLAASIVGFACLSHLARQRMEHELIAQRELILATIKDVLDEVWVFVGTDDARRRIVENLLHRTDRLLEKRPRDSGLLYAKARLLRQHARLLAEDGALMAMETAATDAIAILDDLTHQNADVDVTRAMAEAVVCLGDCLMFQGRLQEAVEQYARAHARLVSALSEHPQHIGLRDDLCWSYDRLAYHDAISTRMRWLEPQMSLALELLNDTPNRPLSKWAVMNAHYRLGHYYADVQSATDLDSARDHFREAIRLGEELTRLEPGRFAWEQMYLECFHRWARVEWRARNIEWLHTNLGTLARRTKEIESRAGDRWFVQTTVLDSHMTLASLYFGLGIQQDSERHARYAMSICTESPLRHIPKHKPQVDRHLATLRTKFLPGEDCGPIDPAQGHLPEPSHTPKPSPR